MSADKQVLLIEDDPLQRKYIGRLLEQEGYEVTTTESAEASLDLVRQRQWELIISDVLLPGINGIDLAKLLKQINPRQKIIIVSGEADMDMVLDALRTHVDAFLTKPVSKEKLLAEIERISWYDQSGDRVKRLTVLAIGAHPDDVEIGCGGSLLRHRAQGDTCHMLTLTDGGLESGYDERMREAYHAADMLGAELHVGDLVDTRVSDGTDTVSLIQRYIDELKPDIIYTHSINDTHQDHRNCQIATMAAASDVPEIYSYIGSSTTMAFHPTRFVNIDEHMDNKLAVLRSYRSQLAFRPYLKSSLIRSTAEYWGRFAGYHLVEPFEVIRS